MSEATTSSLEEILPQLKCHFTWNLFEEKIIPENLEERVNEQIESLYPKFRGTMYNMLAYIKHLDGQNEAALECLKQAEESTRQEHADQAEVRNLVTWGNYAWVYYHLGRLPEAQAYVDKVKQVCEKFSNPYSIECPELNCEEGWTLLKSGKWQTERAMVCFEKNLEKHPNDPEYTSGLAIATYRLSDEPTPVNVIALLHQAIKLNPDSEDLKVVLKLKSRNGGERAKLVEEAPKEAPKTSEMPQAAAKFCERKEDSVKTLQSTPNKAQEHFRIGFKYRGEVLQMTKRPMFGNRDDLNELIQKAIYHLKKAHELDEDLPCVCLYLGELYSEAGQHTKAKHYFQEEQRKALTPVDEQRFHLHYGNVLLRNKEDEKAIHHFLEGVKIQHSSKEKDRIKIQLEKIAHSRLSKDRADPQGLHIRQILYGAA
ncbi:interferon-induced protein with tetratricopeptide repeats 2-like [Suncus etruscus]|uniref:interferon-induced protein with tetratricopeptide repeats 2-like n=1 Tax=Suncus etruscus TaxID=109475 RepID=UPI0021100912|nr:interferon-induced protein with tetratricopeptide repeats 2-like [Suncus etruscus]